MGGLATGTMLGTDISRQPVQILELLGEGGQGFVYKVNYGGQTKALKWYKKEVVKNLDWFHENISHNIQKGSPDRAFLWPEDITEWRDGSFGYIMDLRPAGYVDFDKILLCQANFSSIQAEITAAINIVNGFRGLHGNGYSYQDLNNGNFFVNPQTGDVAICDNDNVSEEGQSSGIGGKLGYMAPEVVCGKKAPDKLTDRFSLAVVLFLLLMRAHPLEGERVISKPAFTEQLQQIYFGEDPIFMLDKEDASNRPVKGVHNNVFVRWPLFPAYIQDLFYRAFDKETMKGSKAAPIEKEWYRALVQLRTDLIHCPNCNGETFAPADGNGICICCRKPYPVSMYIKTGKYRIPVIKDQKLVHAHVFDSDEHNHTLGQVLYKADAQKFGLGNASAEKWIGTLGAKQKEVGSREVMPLQKDVEIAIGREKIHII